MGRLEKIKMKDLKHHILQTFREYTSQYDLKDPNIYLKYVHTEKVAKNCEVIARTLGLNETEIQLAWEIGMLHDIGRFEQLRRFHTFNDAISIDHAEYGADLLFKEGLISKFHLDPKEYDLIETAIRCHSRYRIPEDLSEYEKMFCQIIRDADKIDIYRANYETGVNVVYNVTEEEFLNSDITPEVYQIFLEERTIPREAKKTVADHLVGHIALSFELVYPISRELAMEQGYFEKLLNMKFENEETNATMDKIREKMADWLERQ